MNNNIVYLSSFIPRQKKDYYVSKMHNFNFNSADTFSYAVFRGLVENLASDFQSINILPMGAYPYNNSLFYSKHYECYDNGVLVKTIANSNLYVYQHYSIYEHVLKELKKFGSSTTKTLLIYSLNIPVIKAAIRYKKKLAPKSKIVVIVPDLLEDCVGKSINSKIKMALLGNMGEIYEGIDGFVFLTEQMNERVQTKNPYCVVEAIYDENQPRTVRYDKDGSEKVIFYSGMLYEKFGVKNLIEAFMKTAGNNYRLQLCGCGELEDYIKQKQTEDNRIQYFGLVEREKVLYMQSQATLLVNPRPPGMDFTKYSFPSKNIEYLASGTPTLIYQLPGIPSEYYDYCYSIDSGHLAVDDLADIIVRILSSPKENMAMAKRARKFILDNKNAAAQTKKIINLIAEIQ